MTEAINDAPADDSEDGDAQELLASAVQETSQQSSDDAEAADAEEAALRASLNKARREAQNLRSRLKAMEPLAAKSKSVEDQITELRQQLAERDVADVERNGRMAMTQVHAALAEAGIKKADAAGFLELVDPTTLLTDGQPDEKAIGKLAESVKKLAGRVTPDFDQGRKGGTAPPNMNDLIRRAAGVRS